MDADLSLYWTKEWLSAEFVPMPAFTKERTCKIEISRLVPKQRKDTNNNIISSAHNIKGLITRFRIGLGWDYPYRNSLLLSFHYSFLSTLKA